jgi:hypothetical protein
VEEGEDAAPAAGAAGANEAEAAEGAGAVVDTVAAGRDGPSADARDGDEAVDEVREAPSADAIDEAAAEAAGDDAVVPILADPPRGWVLLQLAIVRLGISPVVQGFLFFGVILQGVVTWLGRARGLVLTGCLYSLIHAFGQAGADPGVFQTVAAIVSFIGVGVVLGVVRLATGSVIAPILLDTAFKAVALFAMTSPDLFAVRGYNVGPDQHTPLVVLVPSLAAVAWGLRAMTRRDRGAW